MANLANAAPQAPRWCQTGAMLPMLFGPPAQWPSQDLIGYSDEFDARVALEAYSCGVFPMPLSPEGEMGWWSPMRRGLLPVGGLHATRSLRKMARRYRTTVDAAFGEVIARCADTSRPHGWIDDRIRTVFTLLHEAGWAHSVETWDDEGRLVGGLYGVHVGGLFAGESMFHDASLGRDASKVALIRLELELLDSGVALLDVQWLTDHLASLGAYEVPRSRYLERLGPVLLLPHVSWPDRGMLSGARLLSLWEAVRRDPSALLRMRSAHA